MSNNASKERERTFSNAVLRAFMDLRVHPEIRCSQRKQLQAKLQPVADADAEIAIAVDGRRKKKTKEKGVQPPKETPTEMPETTRLTEICDTERSHLLDYFDLNDESPEKSLVDTREVTKVVLDEVWDTLKKQEWWEKSGSSVRRVLVQGQSEEQNTVRVLSNTERLWQELLNYQQENAWANCQKAASLAGRLLLFEWEQSGRYSGMMEHCREEAQKFPERFFGGLYHGDTKRITGNILRPLYERHRNLVDAAMQYARMARNRIVFYGTGGKAGTNREIRGIRNSKDPAVLETESRADHLLMQFFPWAQAHQLGTAQNICGWNKFQKDATLFADVYDTFWRNRAVDVSPNDGLLYRLPDWECTWDCVTERLCVCTKARDLKGTVENHKLMRIKLLKEEAEQHKISGSKMATVDKEGPADTEEEIADESRSRTQSTASEDRSDNDESSASSRDKEESSFDTVDKELAEQSKRQRRSMRSEKGSVSSLPSQTTRHSLRMCHNQTSEAAEVVTARKRKLPPCAPARRAGGKKTARWQSPRRKRTRSCRTIHADAVAEALPTATSNTGSDTESDDSQDNDSNVDDNKDVVFDVQVIPRVEEDAATAISVVLPKNGRRFENLITYKSLPMMLNIEKCQEKVKLVATFRKQQSASVYAFIQLSTAPHLTHPAKEARAIHGAAAAAGLPILCLNGDMSVIQADATFLAPGTDEYRSLGLEDILGKVTPAILTDLVNGSFQYGMKAPMNVRKASEHAGESRKAFNLGVGWSGHGYRNGKDAPEGEFAEPAPMNIDRVQEFFPDDGHCLGVLFEALGKVQEAILKHLGRNERPDAERNAKYAGFLGRALGVPGCEAGECLFISIECSKSEIMGRVMARLSEILKKNVTGYHVHLHIDGQNPAPDSLYSRVVMATWTVYFVCEGEHCPMQVTAILCNRSLICNRNVNNEAVGNIRQAYGKGVANFIAECGNVRYADDGLGLFERTTPTVMSYLEDEMSDSGTKGCWVGHKAIEEAATDGTMQYCLVQGVSGKRRSLKTVGDQKLQSNPVAKETSDVEAIETSSILHARMEIIRANPNKLAQYCAERSAAKEVAERFKLQEQHVWNLFFCKMQHYICPAQFIAKCVSLVSQWDDLWAESDQLGQEWLNACQGDGFDGKLASLFMNMTIHVHGNCVSSFLKRVTSAHYDKNLQYTPEFCRKQIELLRQFADDLVQSKENLNTVDILLKATKKGSGTLSEVANVGAFNAPQVATVLFLWGLVEIPCWRASECPILDSGKKHFRTGGDDSESNDTLAVIRMKSLKSVHRAMMIVAHENKTCEIVIENDGCEGIRAIVPYDFLLKYMESFDLRPTEDSHPYAPSYELWYKKYGANEKWMRVEITQVRELLRIWKIEY